LNSTPSNPYHSEVIGSLLRPDYLKQAVSRFDKGELSAEDLTLVQDRAVLDAIALQEACDIDVISDGEMRRRGWTAPLTQSLSGYGSAPMPPINVHTTSSASPMAAQDTEARRSGGGVAIVERLAPRMNLPLQELEFLKQHTQRPYKITLPSLAHASVLWSPGVSDQVYPNREEYMQDALRFTHEMVAACVAASATYVQLDSPRYTHLVSEEGRETFRRLRLDPATWLGEMIALDNALIDDFPNVTWGLHLCRGNGRSHWAVEGGYDPIAEQLFNDIHVDRLLMEYDTPRAGTFAPLRFVPRDKVAVLGLITTKEPAMETDAELRQRVQEAAQFIELDRLALSPQCGFASAFEGNLIDENVQRAKLELCSRVAHQIWG
jgi:5-methyltetrahydropteroyltriglutamate--homocysteine methyltransferase